MPKRYHNGMYEGMASRRHQEHEDAGMIHEDHSAVANLPQQVIMKPFGKSYNDLDGRLDDGISGIDRQIGMDHGKMKSHNVPKKV